MSDTSWVENTLFIIKPDAIERGLTGECITRFERSGLSITHIKCVNPSREKINLHYAHLSEEIRSKIYYYMENKTVIVGVLCGENAIQKARMIAGATEPLKAEIGTIRGDYGSSSYATCAQKPLLGAAIRNLIHTSDSKESYLKEYTIWFT